MGIAIATDEWPASGLERVFACPVCSSESRREEISGLQDRIFGVAPGKWTLQRCLSCRCVYLDPRPDINTIGLAYANYYTHAPAATRHGESFISLLRQSIGNSYKNRLFGTQLRPTLYGAWILALLTPAKALEARLAARGLDSRQDVKGSLLDVGCGNGSFLNFAVQAGWKSFGVEPDAAAAAVASSQGATILGSHIAELRGKFDASFDVVTLSHVIEHLHRPDECLRDSWRMLKSGGFLWIETPNIDSVGYEIYRDAWRGLEPPRHLLLFNPGSLTACVRRAGFADVKMLPPPNAAKLMFNLSASMRAGNIAALEVVPLGKEARKEVEADVRRATKIVNENPDRAEFIRVIAYKP